MTDGAEVVFFLQGAHAVTARYAIRAHARARRQGRHGAAAHDPPVSDRPHQETSLSKFKVVGVIETNMGLGSVSSGGVALRRGLRRAL